MIVTVLPVTVTAIVIEDGTTPPPRVGQEVALTLELLDPARWLLPVPQVDLPMESTPYPRNPLFGPDEWPTRLRNGRLDCYRIATRERWGWLRVSGSLVHRLSGGMVADDVGPTVGTVRRIQVTRSRVVQDERGSWSPSPEDTAARDVVESPRWFAAAVWDPDRRAHVSESGLLLDLDVELSRTDDGRPEPR